MVGFCPEAVCPKGNQGGPGLHVGYAESARICGKGLFCDSFYFRKVSFESSDLATFDKF